MIEGENYSGFFSKNKQFLHCPLCKQIFLKPVTLNCGHTYCRKCLSEELSKQDLSNSSDDNQIAICIKCDGIIWRAISDMSQNLAIQSLVQKFYSKELADRIKKEKQQDMMKSDKKNQVSEEGKEINKENSFKNKILLKIDEPKIIPMPFSYSEITFTSYFIDQITDQSKQLVITWEELQSRRMGLLSSLKRIVPVKKSSNIIFSNHEEQAQLPKSTYQATIYGINFVNLDKVGSVKINFCKKFIVIGGEGSSKKFLDLKICNCSVFHAKNSKQVQLYEFDYFFKFYDNLNISHFMMQIKKMIEDEPFQNRNNPQKMTYCMLRVLRLEQSVRRQILYKFDDVERIQMLNSWINSKRQAFLQEIFNLHVPGKYNSSFVFLVIVILLTLHWFQQSAQ